MTQSDTRDDAETSLDTTPPTPGIGVTAVVDGYNVTITWGEADDNSLEAGLTYRVVRSSAAIYDLDDADAATIVRDYAAYSSAGYTDTGVTPDSYYYNVVVTDEAGNRNVYSDAWVDVTETSGPSALREFQPTYAVRRGGTVALHL